MATDSFRGKFLWHELMTPDIGAAEAFYSKVVGWKAQAWEQNANYKLWTSRGKPMGGLMATVEEPNKTPPPPQWFCYIGTPDVDETVRQAVEIGGRVMKSAMDIPSVGRVAFLTDPHGAAFGAFTPKPAPPSSAMEIELGDFSWHELMTSDWQSAWNFYSKLFGWDKMDAMDMGGGNMYQMFGTGGRMLGGMYTLPHGGQAAPAWLPYALIRDSKRAAEVIKSLGGQVINGPMEVPGGDWITAGIDPQGAMFAVHSKKNAPATVENATTKGTKTAPPKTTKNNNTKARSNTKARRDAKAATTKARRDAKTRSATKARRNAKARSRTKVRSARKK